MPRPALVHARPAGRPRLRTLPAARAGVALTEFALLLPVMILLYFGTIEITQSVIAERRLSLAVGALGDLTTRVKTIGRSDVTDTFGAAAAIMAPTDTTGMAMRISSVVVYPTGQTCVDWSLATNMAALGPGATITLPAAIAGSPPAAAQDYILAEGSLAFRPVTHDLIPGTIRLSEGPTWLVPRLSDRVTADSTIQTASPCS